jgi:hypothetical protein
MPNPHLQAMKAKTKEELVHISTATAGVFSFEYI